MEETKKTMFPDFIATALEAGAEAVSAAARVVEVEYDEGGETGHVRIAIVPAGPDTMKVVSLLDIEQAAVRFAREERLRTAAGPDYRAGTAKLQSISSLIDHANRFKDADSAIWASAADRKLVSILDYHRIGAAGPTRWGRHRGEYSCPLSQAWLVWGGGNPLQLNQEALAALLDSRDTDLASGTLPSSLKPAPTPAQLITMANNLESYSDQKAKRERDPNTGRLRLTFSSDSGFSGDVMPPPAFLISIPVFEDSDPLVIEMRLRAEVIENTARFTLQIHQAGDVLRVAFMRLVELVEADTQLPVFIGTPEA